MKSYKKEYLIHTSFLTMKFILLLWKDFYPYKYMADRKKFNETLSADSTLGKRVRKDFKIKNLELYHDLYVRSNILLLADVFETCRKICLEIYELDAIHLLTVPRLAWKAALEKAKEKLDVLTNINILLMAEKYIRGGICHFIIDMQKVIRNTWNIIMKLKNRQILNTGV